MFFHIRAVTTSGALHASERLQLVSLSSLLQVVLPTSHGAACGRWGAACGRWGAAAFGTVCFFVRSGTFKITLLPVLLPLFLTMCPLSPLSLASVCNVSFIHLWWLEKFFPLSLVLSSPITTCLGVQLSLHSCLLSGALAAEVSPDPRLLLSHSRTLPGAAWVGRPALVRETLGAGCRAVVGLAPSFSDHCHLWPGDQF